MVKNTFDAFVDPLKKASVCYVDPGEPDRLFGRRPDAARGWAMLCGYDERGFAIVIQKAADDRQIMVRAGCRWKSLKAARSHWVSAARNSNASERRSAKQILMLIGIGVSRARDRGWTNKVFNPAPRKVSR